MTVYIPPEGSSYLKANAIQPFDLLKASYDKIPPEAHTVLMGDFNAHINSQSGESPHPPLCIIRDGSRQLLQPACMSLFRQETY